MISKNILVDIYIIYREVAQCHQLQKKKEKHSMWYISYHSQSIV